MMKNVYYVLIISCLMLLSCNVKSKQYIVSLPKDNSNYFDKLGFSYTTIQDADIKLASKLDSLYSEDGAYSRYRMPNNEMIEIIMNDPASLNYDFPKMQAYVSFVTSDDGKLRLYYWDTWMGGTMTDYENLCQFYSNGKVYAYYCGVYDLACPDCEYTLGCNISDIYTIHANNGDTYYLAITGLRESSNLGISSIVPLKIEKNKLVYAPIFDDTPEDYGFNCTSIEYEFADWYYTANYGEGWDWMYRYDKDNMIFYVPVVEDMSLIDRYNLYQFNGNRFEFLREDGGFWLHPSIRNFKNLVALIITKDYRIRLDMMDDGTYRYSSWKRDASMDQKPDIVLYNGYYNEEGRCYTFENEGYEYNLITSNSGYRLSIMHGDKLILLQEQITYSDMEIESDL